MEISFNLLFHFEGFYNWILEILWAAIYETNQAMHYNDEIPIESIKGEGMEW